MKLRSGLNENIKNIQSYYDITKLFNIYLILLLMESNEDRVSAVLDKL
jgi:hypothetical protein